MVDYVMPEQEKDLFKNNLVIDLDSFDSITVKFDGEQFILDRYKLLKLIKDLKQ